MKKILTMWTGFLVLSVFLGGGKADDVENDVPFSKDISKRCYFCTGNGQDVNNIAACSIDKDVHIERCSLEDHYDECVVFQAFSRSKNATIFKRECTSRRFCEERRLCSDPDFVDCRYECCAGDLCNNFDFTNDVGTKIQPTFAMTTRKYPELVQTERNEDSEGTTVLTQVRTTSPGSDSVGGSPIAKQSLRGTNKENHDGVVKSYEIIPVIEDDCQDLDNRCPTYGDSPSLMAAFCKDNNMFTEIACRKTCKFCISKDEAIATTSNSEEVRATSIAITPNVEDCKDTRVDCEDIKKLDYCHLMRDVVKESCAKTCGFCSRETIGTQKRTEPVITGTTTTPFTTKPTATEKRLETEKFTPSKPVTRNLIMKPSTTKPNNTKLPMREKTTTRLKEKVTKTFPVTKDHVQSGKTSKRALESQDCQDERDNCDHFKSMDYCRLMRMVMKMICRRSCGFCGVASENVTSHETTSATISKMTSSRTSPPSLGPFTLKASVNPLKNRTILTIKPTEGPQLSTESNILLQQTKQQTLNQTTTSNGNIPFGPPSGEAGGPTSKGVKPDTLYEEINTTTKSELTSTPETAPEPTERITEITVPVQTTIKRATNHREKMTSSNVVVQTTPTIRPNDTEKNTSSDVVTETTSKITPERTEKIKSSTVVVLTTPKTTPNDTERMTSRTVVIQTTPEELPKPTQKETNRVTSHSTPESTLEPSSEPVSNAKTSEEPKSTSDSTTVYKTCYDKRKECAKFAKFPGYCQYSEKFMRINCPKSCGFCTNGFSGSVPSTAATITAHVVMQSTTKPSLKVTSLDITEITSKSTVVSSEPTPEVTPEPTPQITLQSTPKITSENTTTSKALPKTTTRPKVVATTEKLQSTSKDSLDTKKNEKKYDVVFVIGAQNPNASKSFNQQKKIIQEILKKSSLPDARYGLVVYSDKAQVNFRIDRAVPSKILNALLNLLPWQKEGTQVDKGIRKALEQFGSRPKAKKRIVAFINGQTNVTDKELMEIREDVESKGVKLLVVAVGRGYDSGQLVVMAPEEGDRVLVDGTRSDDVSRELEQAANETIAIITQEDMMDPNVQEGIPGDGIRILGPKNPGIAKFGDKLRWKIWPWTECLEGKQNRAVRCYHLFRGFDYHVIIDACIQHVAAMPDKERRC